MKVELKTFSKSVDNRDPSSDIKAQRCARSNSQQVKSEIRKETKSDVC